MPPAPTSHSSSSAAVKGQRPKSFSPTALTTHATCPRQYAFRYLEDVDVDEPASPHLIFGNALHQALAFLFRLSLPARQDQEELGSVARQALRHYWARQKGREEAFLSLEEEGAWGLDALAVLDRYVAAHERELTTVTPAAVEEWVRAPLPGGLSVGGKVDRTEAVEESAARPAGLIVTDYKTGKRRYQEPYELAADCGAQVYALAATRTFKHPVVAVRFEWLREASSLTWEVEREDLVEIENSLAAQAGQIFTASEFEPVPDWHCRFCPYRQLCPEGLGEARADELDQEPAVSF